MTKKDLKKPDLKNKMQRNYKLADKTNLTLKSFLLATKSI